MPQWMVRVFLAVLISALLNPVHGACAESPLAQEYAVKAAFLYNFAKFVEWPAEAFLNEQTPITICVLGRDPFGSALESVTRDKTAKGRSFLIRRFKAIEDVAGCHILFVSESEQKDMDRILSVLDKCRKCSVLTVSDMEKFARRGGVINFITIEKKIHFEVNMDAASRTGLKISSRLLTLAKIVKDNP